MELQFGWTRHYTTLAGPQTLHYSGWTTTLLWLDHDTTLAGHRHCTTLDGPQTLLRMDHKHYSGWTTETTQLWLDHKHYSGWNTNTTLAGPQTLLWLDQTLHYSVFKEEINSHVQWGDDSYLYLNVSKKKEVCTGFRKNRGDPKPVWIKGEVVDGVSTHKYLDVIFDNKLWWNEKQIQDFTV